MTRTRTDVSPCSWTALSSSASRSSIRLYEANSTGHRMRLVTRPAGNGVGRDRVRSHCYPVPHSRQNPDDTLGHGGARDHERVRPARAEPHHRRLAPHGCQQGRVERGRLGVGQEMQRVAQQRPAFAARGHETDIVERNPSPRAWPGHFPPYQPGWVDATRRTDEPHVPAAGPGQVGAQLTGVTRGTAHPRPGDVHGHGRRHELSLSPSARRKVSRRSAERCAGSAA